MLMLNSKPLTSTFVKPSPSTVTPTKNVHLANTTMPPRASKRLRSDTQADTQAKPPKRSKKSATPTAASAPPRKPTLFDQLDKSPSHNAPNKARDVLNGLDEDGSDGSSLSSLSISPKVDEKADDEDDEDLEFEDVVHIPVPPSEAFPDDLQDVDVSVNPDTRIELSSLGDKKGPTKRERAMRMACHRVHVQCLLWHNALRNSWICDREVQATMLSHLTPKIWSEVDRWQKSGLDVDCESSKRPSKPKPKSPPKGKKRGASASAAKRLEEDPVYMARSDPIVRLMTVLTSFWKQKFSRSTYGIRKKGYMSLRRLDGITTAYNSDHTGPEILGERIESLEDFRKCARECTGSRDVGAQLFTALLRGLGMEARMVASLQPLGFGWTKAEEADPETESQMDEARSTSKDVAESNPAPKPKPCQNAAARSTPKPPKRMQEEENEDVVVIDDSDVTADDDYQYLDDDPDVALRKSQRKQNASYDKSLTFPHYWTEVLSPATKKYLPVEALVKAVVATNRELIESLEPRGAKADRARQVIAYVIGYSQDGSAKDVTLRYLKRQTMPGRTKGMRIPIEKMPVHNRHGKIKRYEHVDWFRVVMKGYERGGLNRKFPLTEVDILEDTTDLKPKEVEQAAPKAGEETLQFYKNSQEFVLERHLKREEALQATAKRVKIFRVGRGKSEKHEDVFLRKDVVQVKSAETWHKQGRAPKEGELPLKEVPFRAATINRKLAITEAEAATGQKVLQGLYSHEQTGWIIPPPIKDGKIPKNEYGNIDLFVEHMVPRGAVHVPFRGAARACKKLGVDFAEAVVDFDFGYRMAVPVIEGVVVAEENHDGVMEQLAKDEKERTRKADEKRRKVVLEAWRKFLVGMRISERLNREYGSLDGGVGSVKMGVFGNGSLGVARDGELGRETGGGGRGVEADVEEDMGGGFLLEGDDGEEDEEEEPEQRQSSNFFPVLDDEDEDDDDGGFILEDGRTTRNDDVRKSEAMGTGGGEDMRSPVDSDAEEQLDSLSTDEVSHRPKRERPTRVSARHGRPAVVEDSEDEDDGVDDVSLCEGDGSDEYVEDE